MGGCPCSIKRVCWSDPTSSNITAPYFFLSLPGAAWLFSIILVVLRSTELTQFTVSNCGIINYVETSCAD